MSRTVVVENRAKEPVPVHQKMLFPGERRRVPRWAAEQGRSANPLLAIVGEQAAPPTEEKQPDATQEELAALASEPGEREKRAAPVRGRKGT